jgi:hypothetical protein
MEIFDKKLLPDEGAQVALTLTDAFHEDPLFGVVKGTTQGQGIGKQFEQEIIGKAIFHIGKRGTVGRMLLLFHGDF